MLNKFAAGLVAAALFAAPVIGGIATSSPADAATTHKTKIVKMQRNHVRHFRVVQCYLNGSQIRHTKLNTGHRFQRVSCFVPTKVLAKLQLRNGNRHMVKHVKHITRIKQVRHVKPVKLVKHVKHLKQVRHLKPVKFVKHNKQQKIGRTG